ncbi:DUF3017 domain-containing protein [Janibacter limosus]|uniref:DUF3017 domain-containing protein n=1 Tax=Janibacter limosus TaxID=53458 RepID=UPI0035D93F95|nr:DUF3017 domain-containing protein [Janibacter limosus]
MSDPGAGEDEDGGWGAHAQRRPALDTRPLSAWWVIFAGPVVGLLFVLTDHMLRATVSLGGALLLAAVLRVALPGSGVGGIAVRGPVVDVVLLVLLGVAARVSGFTLDLAAR